MALWLMYTALYKHYSPPLCIRFRPLQLQQSYVAVRALQVIDELCILSVAVLQSTVVSALQLEKDEMETKVGASWQN